jgi:hypothetical protein
MDCFQFVFESPQAAQNHKKRPRLVTSCDNWYAFISPVVFTLLTLLDSRLKKIKCLQTSPDAKCDACNQANVSCRFRDRERYFVERSRVMAGPNSRSPSGDVPSKSARKFHGRSESSHHNLFIPSEDPMLEDCTASSTSGTSFSEL